MQDWAGPIEFAFAERRPKLVRAFVLGSTWAWPIATDEPRGMGAMIACGPLGEFAQLNFKAVVHAAISSSMVRLPPKEVVDLFMTPPR